MKIKGNVSYQDLEGGFWGIIDSAGNRYVPVEGLPSECLVDGIAIIAEVEPVEMLGTTMWGSYVKVSSISNTD